jgi:hypothetical protein
MIDNDARDILLQLPNLQLPAKPLFGLFLSDGANAHADANATVALVDEAAPIGADRGAGGAGCSRGLLHSREEEHTGFLQPSI